MDTSKKAERVVMADTSIKLERVMNTDTNRVDERGREGD